MLHAVTNKQAYTGRSTALYETSYYLAARDLLCSMLIRSPGSQEFEIATQLTPMQQRHFQCNVGSASQLIQIQGPGTLPSNQRNYAQLDTLNEEENEENQGSVLHPATQAEDSEPSGHLAHLW